MELAISKESNRNLQPGSLSTPFCPLLLF